MNEQSEQSGTGTARPLDYANPRHFEPGAPKLPRSIRPGAVIGLCAILTPFHHNYGPLEAMIPIIWLCGPWYCWERVGESSAGLEVKRILRITSIISVVLAPFFICPHPGASVVLYDLVHYGWHTRYVSTLERSGVILMGICLLVHGVVQPLDWYPRWKRSRDINAGLRERGIIS